MRSWWLLILLAASPALPCLAWAHDAPAGEQPALGQAVSADVPATGMPPDRSNEAGEPAAEAEAAASTTTAASIDDIFRQVFGRERPNLGSDEFAVRVNGINSGLFTVEPPSLDGKGGWVARSFVERILIPILLPELHERALRLGAGAEVSLEELREMGLDVAFDHRRLALSVEVPNQMRAQQTINVRALAQQSENAYAQRARLSGYINLFAGADLIEDSESRGTGLDRLALDFDSALRIGPLVIEGAIDFDSRRTETRWRRDDLLLSYDDRATMMRYELGDLSIGRRPYQGNPRIAGIAAFRDFSINPYRQIRPTPSQEFELEQPARVEILLNGLPLRTLDLPSGRFSLRNFPLISSAANDVRLRLTYASGRIEELVFPAFFDFELLDAGLQEFGFNAGIPYSTSGGLRDYDTGNVNVLGYYRRGLSDDFTAGINVEADKDFANLGMEAIWASPWGTVSLDVASDVRNAGIDATQAIVQYRWRDTDIGRDRSIDGLIQLTGREFRTLDQLFGENLIEMQSRVRVGQAISPTVRAQLFASYETYHQDIPDSYSIGLSLSSSRGRLQLGGSVEYRNSLQQDEYLGRLSVAISFGRTSLTSSYETQDNAVRTQFTRIEPYAIGAVSASGSIERSDRSDRHRLRLGYVGNRFEASVQQFANNYLTPAEGSELYTEFRGGSALVMADGTFGLSRPVSNSFAIFAPSGDAKFDLAVDRQTSLGGIDVNYLSEADSFGPAIVNNIIPYYNRRIDIEPRGNSAARLENTVFSLNADYRSGYLIRIGSGGSVALVGNLVDREGDPIALASGTFAVVGSAEPTPGVVFFTNRAGRFYIEGLEPGQEVAITIGSTSAVVAIPAEAEGIVALTQDVSLDTDVAPPEIAPEQESDR